MQIRKFALTFLAAVPLLSAAATLNGEWTLSRSDTAGKVRFTIESTRDAEHSFSSSSDWNTSDFSGLDLSTPDKHDVHFTIHRDAGDIECEGFMRDGQGAGLFTFRANPQYTQQMAALGFSGISDDQQFSFALHDVSLAYAREMKDAGVQDLDARQLIAFRIHRVSVEYVRALAQLGYANPPARQLIALRIHGVTPEYIQKLRAHGMQNLTLQQLVKLRIFGID